MSSSLNDRLASILKQSVDAILNPLGFRKRGVVYRYRLPELWWLVDIQRSRWNTSMQCEFTINFGVYVCGMAPVYNPLRSDPKLPTVADGVVNSRVGWLDSGIRDLWWRLTLEDDAEKVDFVIIGEINHQLKCYVLPFLHRFQSKWDVVHFLEELLEDGLRHRRVTWPATFSVAFESLGIVYWLIGEREQCCRAIERAKQEVLKTRIDGAIQRVEQLYQRLCVSTEKAIPLG